MNMLEKTLNDLGLGNKEIVVYKLILEYGKIAPALLSRLAKINRTTIYSVAKELKDKGLIIEDLGGKTLYYLPVKGNELGKIIKKEQESLAKKENSINELQNFLKNIPESKTYSVPKIRFIEEGDIKDYLHEASPKWNESMLATDTTWWGFQDHTFVENFEDWIHWYWKNSPKEIDLRLFSNDKEIEKHMAEQNLERRNIRFWNGVEDFTATQWVIGSYIVMIITNQKPHYLVEVHDSVMAHNMREVFKKLWEEKN
jgi:sugar-specific transcriptional regulator TrmB